MVEASLGWRWPCYAAAQSEPSEARWSVRSSTWSSRVVPVSGVVCRSVAYVAAFLWRCLEHFSGSVLRDEVTESHQWCLYFDGSQFAHLSTELSPSCC